MSATVGGGAAGVGSGGLLAPVAVAGAVAGALATSHGLVVASNAIGDLINTTNFFSQSTSNIGTNSNRLQPDPKAEGAHSVFKKDATGKTTKYETFQPQSNPQNPNKCESVKRYDKTGKAHFNKKTQEEVSTPYVHDPKEPGGVRKPKPEEEPSN